MKSRSWYHWLAFVFFIASTLLIGATYVAYGASAGSPFFYIDNIVIRMLGIVFILCVFLALRKIKLGFTIASVCYVISAIEIAITYLFGTDSIPAFSIAMVCLTYVLFSALSFWLSQFFANTATNA